jgi:hypothetical protein
MKKINIEFNSILYKLNQEELSKIKGGSDGLIEFQKYLESIDNEGKLIIDSARLRDFGIDEFKLMNYLKPCLIFQDEMSLCMSKMPLPTPDGCQA